MTLSEWRMLRNISIQIDKNDIFTFWKAVHYFKKEDNFELFPNLNKFIMLLFFSHHNSTSIERIFSVINLNKTKSSNKLSTEILQEILLYKNILNTQKKSCFNFYINKEMMKNILI